MTKYYLILFFSSLFVLFGCNEDEPENEPALKARVNVTPTYQGNPISFNEKYTTQEGYTISYTKINFIVTRFRNNGKQLFESAVYKFEDDQKLLWEGVGDYTNFNSFTAIMGVDSTQNHEDPSARDANDPLFILNSGDMHWGWNTGYIFVMLEGKADTTANQTGQNLMNFSYHIGNDQLTREFSFNNLQWSKVNNYLYETNLKVDLYKVFDGDVNDVDIKNERSSHTNPDQIALSEKIMDNFMNAFYK
ncbi:hypothetical protein CW751_14305 [Brumimicrobium salinarum]|uniref:Copper-binding protein MbnP-like domain-containing protein n=1 Tax=Brumimicrobium salinarum TaxID=2058658 RepID=A0A2I0QZ41_9FLAO|nr:MbnP family protein [Brumimicrobium salinarum]PKR79587.1 hypothetical protein CW751_14305 [Brumimicrobium salinarum]